VTARQPFLGKLDWIRLDVAKPAEVQVKVAAKGEEGGGKEQK
jgi:hypothetical protein